MSTVPGGPWVPHWTKENVYHLDTRVLKFKVSSEGSQLKIMLTMFHLTSF